MKAGESSTIVAFRALVMLACLIVAPLAAIFGSAFPDLVRAILIDPFLNRKSEPTSGASQTAPAPFFPSPASALDGNPGASSVGGGNLAGNSPPPVWQPPGITGGLLSANPLPSSPSSGGGSLSGLAARPASGYAPVTTPAGPAGDPTSSGFASGNLAGGGITSGGIVGGSGPRPAPANLARFDAPADSASATGASSSVYGAARGPGNDTAPRFSPLGASGPLNASAAARGPGETEQFGWIEKRLRDAGATYYLLETWGAEGDLYRFHCKMAVANSPNYTRHFEATDRDKLQAMARVLEQVEAWRAGRLP